MERGRRLAIAAVGLTVMLVTAVLVLRVAGGDGEQLVTEDEQATVDALEGELPDLGSGPDLLPGDPPQPDDTTAPLVFADTVPIDPEATLPAPGVATIALPDFSTTAPTTRAPAGAPGGGPAFSERGVWVVKVDGTTPILVARDATAGVASGGTWVAFVEKGAVRAAPRTDLRSRVELAPSGVAGTAAQGLPIAGGKRGVAFLREDQALLVDPAAPQETVAVAAPGATAVAAEEDGAGRLLWAGADGLHVGGQPVEPAVRVERGMLVMGHDQRAHQQADRVVVDGGAPLDWGAVDRLQTGPGGLVAASGGRIRLRTPGGEVRQLLERASTPVVTGSRVLYVSDERTIASASLTGTDVRVVARAASTRTITNLDLLDDSTLVVTVG